jgi:hypothetical protein
MNKFEYKIKNYNTINSDTQCIQNSMDELGNSGWELCGVDKDGLTLKCFFKRVIEEVPTESTGPR